MAGRNARVFERHELRHVVFFHQTIRRPPRHERAELPDRPGPPRAAAARIGFERLDDADRCARSTARLQLRTGRAAAGPGGATAATAVNGSGHPGEGERARVRSLVRTRELVFVVRCGLVRPHAGAGCIGAGASLVPDLDVGEDVLLLRRVDLLDALAQVPERQRRGRARDLLLRRVSPMCTLV